MLYEKRDQQVNLLYLKEYLAKRCVLIASINYKVNINQSSLNLPNLYEIKESLVYRHSGKSFATIHKKSKKLIIAIIWIASFSYYWFYCTLFFKILKACNLQCHFSYKTLRVSAYLNISWIHQFSPYSSKVSKSRHWRWEAPLLAQSQWTPSNHC